MHRDGGQSRGVGGEKRNWLNKRGLNLFDVAHFEQSGRAQPAAPCLAGCIHTDSPARPVAGALNEVRNQAIRGDSRQYAMLQQYRAYLQTEPVKSIVEDAARAALVEQRDEFDDE